jgi:peptide/nickel transport system substrate-binding protein
MRSRSRGISTIVIAAIIIVIIVIAGIGVYIYQSQLPRLKETLIMGTTDSVESVLDPVQAYDFFGWEIIQATGSGLVDLAPGTPNGASIEDIVPSLATDWSSSDDGLTWTFNLRQGVKYDDGTEFNATHVKYTFDRGIRIAHPDGAWVGIGIVNTDAPSTAIINRTEVTDTYQVKFHLNFPFAPFLSLMACQATFIVNPKYAPVNAPVNYTAGDARASYAMDLGPYNLTAWTRTAGKDQEMRLSANTNYWDAGSGLPKSKNIVIKFYSDATALGLAIAGGEIDVAFRQLRASDIIEFEDNPDVTVWKGTGAFIQYMVFQHEIPPFDDSNVRRAVAAAVNRTALTKTVFYDQAQPLYSMVPIGLAGHTDAFKKLGDANYTFTQNTLNNASIHGGPYTTSHKLVVDLWYENSGHYPQSADLAVVLEESLEASGVIQVNLHGLDWPAYRAKRNEETMPVYIYGWYPDYVDTDDYIYPFLHSSGGSWLHLNYANPEMDKLIGWARGNTTETARDELYAQIQDLMVTDTPMVSLYQSGAYAVTKTNVKGVYLDISQNWRHWLVYAEE